jgi:hypothetical protein
MATGILMFIKPQVRNAKLQTTNEKLETQNRPYSSLQKMESLVCSGDYFFTGANHILYMVY